MGDCECLVEFCDVHKGECLNWAQMIIYSENDDKQYAICGQCADKWIDEGDCRILATHGMEAR